MPCSKGYGSQGGQDRWVAASAANTSLYFVDLAANDAECLSNTVRLERELGFSCRKPLRHGDERICYRQGAGEVWGVSTNGKIKQPHTSEGQVIR